MSHVGLHKWAHTQTRPYMNAIVTPLACPLAREHFHSGDYSLERLKLQDEPGNEMMFRQAVA